MLRFCSSRTILTATSLDLGAADDGGKARHAAIDQLDTPRAQADVIDRAVQMTGDLFAVARVDGGAGEFDARVSVPAADRTQSGWLRMVFSGEQGCHAAIQGFAQVRRPVALGGDGVEQVAGMLEHICQLTKFFHRVAGQAVNGGQVSKRCSGTRSGSQRPFSSRALFQHAFSFGNQALAPRMARVAIYRDISSLP